MADRLLCSAQWVSALPYFVCASAAAAEAGTQVFELELGVGIGSFPAYSGSDSSVPQARLWASIEYHTMDSGTIAFDSGRQAATEAVIWLDADDEPYRILSWRDEAAMGPVRAQIGRTL